MRGSSTIPSIGRRARRLIRDLRYRSKIRLRVPMALVTASIVLFTAFIVGGGIYDMLDDPLPILRGPQGYIAVRGDPQAQTQLESALSMLFTVLSFVGIFISYRSTQVIYDSKRATATLILGIALILLGLSGSYYLLNLKRIILRRYGF